MKKSSSIPVYNLQEKGKGPIDVRKIEYDSLNSISLQAAHRDENYLLFFQQSGKSEIVIDFREFVIEGCAILYVLPGQVHYGMGSKNTQAWVMAIDTAWIHDSFREIFMERAAQITPVFMNETDAQLFSETFQLLFNFTQEHHHCFQEQAIRAMAEVCLSLFASEYKKQDDSSLRTNLRINTITRQFRSLLLANFRTMKSPSDYAASIHISPVYLNEAVKQTTGHPVSYWIHQEIILEAKRILFYTNLTVKEIAHTLGYDDPTYFIRLFSKVAGLPPLQFRRKYRK